MRLNTFWAAGDAIPSGMPLFATSVYDAVLPYVQQFLCSPHPFRKGIMCPFVPKAIKQRRIFFTACDGMQAMEAIKASCKFYLRSHHERKSFGAVIILFPEDFSITKLLNIHVEAKKYCIKHGLMLGALWSENKATSLHSTQYFPLRTPTPILVIRDITISDFIFMAPTHYSIATRLSFLNTFIRKFESEKKQVCLAKRLRRKYRIMRCLKLLTIVPIIVFILWLRSS